MSIRWTAAVVLALAAGGIAQETADESILVTAIRKTKTAGFRYTLTPAASLPSFPEARTALAGLPIRGAYRDGLFHATDGTFEIYRMGDRVAVRTETGGWLPLLQFTAPLRLEVEQAFDPADGRRWARGNVTQGKKALLQLIQLDHLVHRSDIARLTRLETALIDLRPVGPTAVGGEKTQAYEGDLNDLAAFDLLQGPFDELVRRGNLSFRNVSGVGRVYLIGDTLRRIQAKAGGTFGFYNEEDNVRRRGFCTLELVAEITDVGRTEIAVPREAAPILR